MSTDADAREGRGAANGCNKNWYNSPLWDNIGPKKKVYEAAKVDDTTEVAKPKTEEELIRERQRAAFKYAY